MLLKKKTQTIASRPRHALLLGSHGWRGRSWASGPHSGLRRAARPLRGKGFSGACVSPSPPPSPSSRPHCSLQRTFIYKAKKKPQVAFWALLISVKQRVKNSSSAGSPVASRVARGEGGPAGPGGLSLAPRWPSPGLREQLEGVGVRGPVRLVGPEKQPVLDAARARHSFAQPATRRAAESFVFPSGVLGTCVPGSRAPRDVWRWGP